MGFTWLGSCLMTASPIGSPGLTSHAWWEWALFAGVVITLLAIDLKGHKHDGPMPIRVALTWSAVWIALAMVFMAGIFWKLNSDAGLQFLTGYLVEKSLSVDNLFVFLVIFRFFKIAPAHQHRILFWGVLGAIAMRAVLILFCVELVQYAKEVFYVFGGILLWSAAKMFTGGEKDANPEHSWTVKLARRMFPFTSETDGDRFFIRREGKNLATPLFLVLIIVELSDLMFAVDSIPAVLAISQDYFIVLTSNIFAILGLRALYFVLHGLMDSFRYLGIGLALILAFIGVKLILMPIEVHFPTIWSLTVIASILALSILASVLIPARPETESPDDPASEANPMAPMADGVKTPVNSADAP